MHLNFKPTQFFRELIPHKIVENKPVDTSGYARDSRILNMSLSPKDPLVGKLLAGKLDRQTAFSVLRYINRAATSDDPRVRADANALLLTIARRIEEGGSKNRGLQRTVVDYCKGMVAATINNGIELGMHSLDAGYRPKLDGNGEGHVSRLTPFEAVLGTSINRNDEEKKIATVRNGIISDHLREDGINSREAKFLLGSNGSVSSLVDKMSDWTRQDSFDALVGTLDQGEIAHITETMQTVDNTETLMRGLEREKRVVRTVEEKQPERVTEETQRGAKKAEKETGWAKAKEWGIYVFTFRWISDLGKLLEGAAG
jgi:hypothetical protein